MTRPPLARLATLLAPKEQMPEAPLMTFAVDDNDLVTTWEMINMPRSMSFYSA